MAKEKFRGREARACMSLIVSEMSASGGHALDGMMLGLGVLLGRNSLSLFGIFMEM